MRFPRATHPYIRLAHGFVYLVAILDWYSRHVLSWELSTTLDTGFCLEALERAVGISKPEIFNSDQGLQFTSMDFTGRLEKAGIKVSMDGRGRVYDNIFVERLWRSVKYEEVYLHDYMTVPEARSDFPIILCFTTRSGRTRRWVTGRRMKFILGRGQCWHRLRRPWFDMDRLDIVVPRASWSDVFSGSTAKMAFRLQNG